MEQLRFTINAIYTQVNMYTFDKKNNTGTTFWCRNNILMACVNFILSTMYNDEKLKYYIIAVYRIQILDLGSQTYHAKFKTSFYMTT